MNLFSSFWDPASVEHKPKWSNDGHKIAYVKLDNKKLDLIIIDLDNNKKQLLKKNCLEFSWSPDGKKIAFSKFVNNNDDVYVIDSDGSQEKRLTKSMSIDDRPIWSPDGSKILFTRGTDQSKYDLYIMNADGSQQRRLTYETNHQYKKTTLIEINDADWSPDSKKITYEVFRYKPKIQRIERINSDGSSRRILNSQGINFFPRWSPDGNWVSFISRENQEHLVISRPDGSEIKYLLNLKGFVGQYAWAPNNEEIAFSYSKNEKLPAQIYLYSLVSNNFKQLTHNSVNDTPFWSPDGRKIGFISYRGGRGQLYLMNKDGSNETFIAP
jgi:tol-pal system beta propeller repeat protein TolB